MDDALVVDHDEKEEAESPILGSSPQPSFELSPAEPRTAIHSPADSDFRRSVSRGLPPVQEEPHEEDMTVNRDSGFVAAAADSPMATPWTRHRFEDDGAQQRDSGVHLRPTSSSSRGVSPEGGEGARLSAALSTPLLEALEPPVTPEEEEEPHKKYRRATRRKYPDLGPGPLTTTRSPSPSTSVASARAASNTSITRARTPEHQHHHQLMRHSGTPPLRSRRTRSGDLRSLTQSTNRSATASPLAAPVVAIGLEQPPGPLHRQSLSPAPALTPAAAVPASSCSSPASAPAPAASHSDLRRTTSTAAAVSTTSLHNAAAAPIANEGRVRAKDMADVYVSLCLGFWV